jgi:hypothetical protein
MAGSSPDLSAAQRQQVATPREKTARQLAPLREQLNARQKELLALWSAEPPNRTALLQKESEATGLRQKCGNCGSSSDSLCWRYLHQRSGRPGGRNTEGVGWEERAWACGCMQGGNDMGGMHGGGMGNMHGGMRNMHGGNTHGGMASGGGMEMGADECLDCMDCMNCEGAGACATPPSPPAAVAPAAPRPN